MSPWHLSRKLKPDMLWDEGYVSRLIFTQNQVDNQREVKLSSATVRWRIYHVSSSLNPAVLQEACLWPYFCRLAAVTSQLFSLWPHSVAASEWDRQQPVKLPFATLMLST